MMPHPDKVETGGEDAIFVDKKYFISLY